MQIICKLPQQIKNHMKSKKTVNEKVQLTSWNGNVQLIDAILWYSRPNFINTLNKIIFIYRRTSCIIAEVAFDVGFSVRCFSHKINAFKTIREGLNGYFLQA